MRWIQKGKEPESLLIYRKQKNAYFDGANKKDIREALLRDQGSLCAYCMKRISINDMKIEHLIPQHPENGTSTDKESLEYSRMLGVCNGKPDGVHLTCDSSRGNMAMTVNPLREDCINRITYDREGVISSIDVNINTDLDVTLNLNIELLRLNRKCVLESCINELKRQKDRGNWNTNLLRKMLRIFEERDSEGNYKEFSGIAISYLKNKLEMVDHSLK